VFWPQITPRAVHKNATHHLCGNRAEVRAVLPIDVPLPDQLQVGLATSAVV